MSTQTKADDKKKSDDLGHNLVLVIVISIFMFDALYLAELFYLK